MSKQYSFTMRVGPTSYNKVKHLKYYTQKNPYEVNTATGGNCTWYAWGRFWEVMASVKTKYQTKRPTLVSSSNACYFYSDGKKNGYSCGLKPKPGAIICWGYYGKPHGNPGHVAFVEKVNMKKGEVYSIEISQSGWSSGPMSNKVIYPGTGKKGSGYDFGYNNSYFNGFIYNPVNFGNPAGAVNSDDDSKPKEWYIKKYGTGAKVYFELRKYSYTHKACCAVLGNMQQESGLRLYTNGSFDGMGSEGLCQWTGGRKTAMEKYAEEHSSSRTWKSVDGQVAYLVYELHNSEKAADAILKDNKLSLKTMTEKFEEKFERADPKYANLKARVDYAKEWDARMSGAGEGSSETTSVNMQQRINKLYHSNNYEYLTEREQEENENITRQRELNNTLTNSIRNLLQNTSFSFDDVSSGAIPEIILGSGPEKSQKDILIRTKSEFDISKALIQAPFVELDIGGYTVGSYHSSLDDYPNYISKLDVKKINGEINQYTIGMVYQIRPGEDPNLLDKLFSKVRYNKIGIRYGDCESGALFKDSEAIITNIVANRDYASSRISYTIYATSACNYVTSIKFDFRATTDRPSNVIRNLLYTNPETSKLLLDTFPGMRDLAKVDSSNLIPYNDTTINIVAKKNIDVISYINYLVGCMSNVTNAVSDIIRNSMYFITYEDDNDGSYFKIQEIKNSTGKVYTNNLFEVTVGYPDGNDIYNFTVNNDQAWSMLYDYNSTASEYIYDINSNGDNTLDYSPNLVSSSEILNEIQKNWWTQMTTFPITAQLSMRGLLKPIHLMDYVRINVVFYGQQHITSGLYAITGEQDILSGSGFMTNLSLLRVGD